MAGGVSWTSAEMTRCQWAACLLPPGSAVLTQHRRLAEEPRHSPTLPGAPLPAHRRCQGRLAFPEAAQASRLHPSPACCPLPRPQGPAVPSDWRGRHTAVLGLVPAPGGGSRAAGHSPPGGLALLGVTGQGLIRDTRGPPTSLR